MEIKLQEFVRKTLEEIKAGLPNGYLVEESIDFKVALTTSTNKSGGVEIKVISGGIEKGNELVQIVSFSVINEIEKDRSTKSSAETILKYVGKGLKTLNKISEEENKNSKSKKLPK